MTKTNPRLSEESLANVSISSQSETSADYAGQKVVVWDDKQPRLQMVNRVISCCGAKSDCREGIADLAALQPSQSSLIAVVALAGMSESPGSGIANLALERLCLLRRKGYRIVAYEDGAHDWPLGVQCQTLLSGANRLLDSAQPDFSHQLQMYLSQLLRAESQRIETENLTRREMRRLGLVGESELMLSVFGEVMRVSAMSDLSTLITGETGTGKELLARAIHQLDLKRRHGPFVAINCGAVNPGVAESELFGHRRGAFTGASADRRGLIRSAQGGVLFLDEVGELEAGLQTKLLRVLQEGRVLGVGDDLETSINVRIIAATNRNLKEMVCAGQFRADLFHRLNLLSIHVPPLRERSDDIRPLVEHFLHKHRALRPDIAPVIGSDFLAALTLIELPGNVRQLENVVRWVLVHKNDEMPLNLGDLPQEIWEQLIGRSKAFLPAVYSGNGQSLSQESHSDLHGQLMNLMSNNGWNLAQSLEYCERILVESALQISNGNQAQTARLLGLTPRSVYNKVHKHHLDQ